MRPVSPAFLAALRGSHTMVARAKVLTEFQTGANPAGTEIAIMDGDVRMDATSDIRSTLDLTTDGVGMWPRFDGDLLAPYGNELFVERGIVLGNTREWVSLGYYRIYSPDQDDAPDGPIRITGRDRMSGIIDARLLAPIQFTPGTTLGDIVEILVTEVYPDAVIEWDDDTENDTLGRSVVVEQERYEFLRDLVESRGKVMYFDHRGVLVIRDPPDEDIPVFEVNSGAGGVLINLARQLSREGVYNAVVASGEAADDTNPVRAVAIDNNPTSPTYFYGPFGPVPRFYSSPFITTAAHAFSAATSLLFQNLGLSYAVDLSAVPNPALEPDDPIRVTYPTGSEIHILEAVTVPLTSEAAMTGRTRTRSVVLIGTSSEDPDTEESPDFLEALSEDLEESPIEESPS